MCETLANPVCGVMGPESQTGSMWDSQTELPSFWPSYTFTFHWSCLQTSPKISGSATLLPHVTYSERTAQQPRFCIYQRHVAGMTQIASINVIFQRRGISKAWFYILPHKLLPLSLLFARHSLMTLLPPDLPTRNCIPKNDEDELQSWSTSSKACGCN